MQLPIINLIEKYVYRDIKNEIANYMNQSKEIESKILNETDVLVDTGDIEYINNKNPLFLIAIMIII